MDPKLPRSHFFPKRIHQKKFQLKIPIFSKSDDGATWWPNSYKKILTCGQLRNTQRYQKYVWLVRAFFLEFLTFSSQQWQVFFRWLFLHMRSLKNLTVCEKLYFPIFILKLDPFFLTVCSNIYDNKVEQKKLHFVWIWLHTWLKLVFPKYEFTI